MTGFQWTRPITAVARALAEVTCSRNKAASRRHDAPALALLDIELAQFGDFVRAKAFLHRAALALGAKGGVVHAKWIATVAQIALIARPARAAARGRSKERGDWLKATLGPATFPPRVKRRLREPGSRSAQSHARHLDVGSVLLIGAFRGGRACAPQALDATRQHQSTCDGGADLC